MKFRNQSMTLLGTITQVDKANHKFSLLMRSDETIDVCVKSITTFQVLTNLDELNYDRVENPPNFDGYSLESRIEKYLRSGGHIYAQGTLVEKESDRCFEAEQVTLLHYKENGYVFETNTHWWLSQITTMGDELLQVLFGDSRDYEASDFSRLYRTFLNIYGGPTDNNVQHMQALSRLIYGLSSTYLLIGDIRFLNAAKAGVDFQRTAFRTITHDGQNIIWSHARIQLVEGNKTIIPSQLDNEKDTIPLYEQIYALAGLTQYFRITGDGEVLNDIIRTVKSFNKFYRDEKSINPDYPGNGGYFSHIDPVTFNSASPALGINRLKKNWNSIGDHIPAYLINIILALEPLPVGNDSQIENFLHTCKKMLDELTNYIIEKFPDPSPDCPYVNERFYDDWRPDHEWAWQQNRAIVGHNLKIAWNLIRIANYYSHMDDRAADIERIRAVAEKLAMNMKDAGIDLLRGGCFDAVERDRKEGYPIDFVWGNHKDHWQQEQGVLAYLALYGFTGNELYHDLASDMMAWWNAFHLDRENRSIFSRVDDNGLPVVKGRGMADDDVAGYHSFELNYLAHIYLRCYTENKPDRNVDFCLYFRPDVHTVFNFINVLPDFLKPGTVEISGITVNGKARDYVAPDNFQIPIDEDELGKEFIIQFRVLNNPLTAGGK